MHLGDEHLKALWMKQAHAMLGFAVLALGFAQVWTGWRELNEADSQRMEGRQFGMLAGVIASVALPLPRLGPYVDMLADQCHT